MNIFLFGLRSFRCFRNIRPSPGPQKRPACPNFCPRASPSGDLTGRSPRPRRLSGDLTGRSFRPRRLSGDFTGRSFRPRRPSSDLSGRSYRPDRPSDDLSGRSYHTDAPSDDLSDRSCRLDRPFDDLSGRSIILAHKTVVEAYKILHDHILFEIVFEILDFTYSPDEHTSCPTKLRNNFVAGPL